MRHACRRQLSIAGERGESGQRACVDHSVLAQLSRIGSSALGAVLTGVSIHGRSPCKIAEMEVFMKCFLEAKLVTRELMDFGRRRQPSSDFVASSPHLYLWKLMSSRYGSQYPCSHLRYSRFMAKVQSSGIRWCVLTVCRNKTIGGRTTLGIL